MRSHFCTHDCPRARTMRQAEQVTNVLQRELVAGMHDYKGEEHF